MLRIIDIRIEISTKHPNITTNKEINVHCVIPKGIFKGELTQKSKVG